jgi:biotin carboxyl carrier protein
MSTSRIRPGRLESGAPQAAGSGRVVPGAGSDEHRRDLPGSPPAIGAGGGTGARVDRTTGTAATPAVRPPAGPVTGAPVDPTREPPGDSESTPAGLPAGHHDGRDRPVLDALPPVDPRAVRVGLAPPSRVADERPIEITPPRAVSIAPVVVGTAGADGPGRSTNPDDGPEGARTEVPWREGSLREGDRLPRVDGRPERLELLPREHGRHVLVLGGSDAEPPIRIAVVLEAAEPRPGGGIVREVLVDGFRFEVEVESARLAALRERAIRARAAVGHGGPLPVHAILPGRVAAISVAPGDPVTAGQQLLVVEAMKMQNEIRASRDGTVEQVHVAPGTSIEVGDLLVVIS